LSSVPGERATLAASDPDFRDDPAGLRRMRFVATGMLAALVALLLASVLGQASYPWLAWVRAFAEAGTVGAVADWYAVVALFRHPFGLPIPHTAIIPRNQARIAESLGSFVERNFLAPDLIAERLRTHNGAMAMGSWLATPANSRALVDPIADAIPRLLDTFDDDDVARFFERIAEPRLRAFDPSRLAGSLLQILTDNDRHAPLLDRALRAMEHWLTLNSGLLKAKFSEASRYTPGRFDAYIVDKFVEGIVALMNEVGENPEHPLRSQLDDSIAQTIVWLRTSERSQRIGRIWMRDCIRHLKHEHRYRHLWQQLRGRLRGDITGSDSMFRATASRVLASIGAAVAQDPVLQRKLNAWGLRLVHAMVVRYRHQVPALISDVVRSWDTDEISRKIEAEIGRDLQFIRINGTLVGGTIGLMLHAASLLIAR